MKTIIIKMILMTMLLGSCHAQQKQHSLKKDALEPKIDALVRQYLDLDIFSGVVLVAEQGEPVYHKAFGLADRTTKTPNTIHTKFDIGSMNKTFTRVVALQLIDEGKLKFDDRLGRYLSGFPEQAADKITVEQLLNHTSGYGDYWGPDFDSLPLSKKTIAGLVERIRQLPLHFEPGTDTRYSNSGYILLGAIIEKVTGKTYHQNVKERIIAPLKLNDTYVENKYEVPQRATGYFKTVKGVLKDNNGFVELPNPDGGFQATAMDMLTFHRAFFYGHTLLSEAMKTKDRFFDVIREHAGTGGAIPLAGGFPGANTVHYEILRDKIAIVVFANMDEPVAEQLGAGILAIIRGKTPEKPSLPAAQNVYIAYNEHGLEYVKDHFEQLTRNFHPTDPKSLILNTIGYTFLSDGSIAKAIGVFTLNTELFPEDPNVWDSLGEACAKNGERAKAIRYYKKALEIDPAFPSARNMLEQLEKGR
ncbi:MAG: serine hydrolase [Sinomicrobium sp.]|nr:serine hydrolase [Sinomicrobium sp.]